MQFNHEQISVPRSFALRVMGRSDMAQVNGVEAQIVIHRNTPSWIAEASAARRSKCDLSHARSSKRNEGEDLW